MPTRSLEETLNEISCRTLGPSLIGNECTEEKAFIGSNLPESNVPRDS